MKQCYKTFIIIPLLLMFSNCLSGLSQYGKKLDADAWNKGRKIKNTTNNYIILEIPILKSSMLKNNKLNNINDYFVFRLYILEENSKLFDLNHYVYSNPPKEYWRANYPPEIKILSTKSFMSSFLFRDNCIYRFPINRGSHQFRIDYKQYKNIFWGGVYRKTIQLHLQANQSVYFIINPTEHKDLRYKVVPTPEKDGPCEFRDKYLKEQADKRKLQKNNEGENK